ncbi:exported hypothetical protein [Nitrosopumilaceae archaeon]|nr:exported hypothetical protein [Nitrosopumilaceae archaeon]
MMYRAAALLLVIAVLAAALPAIQTAVQPAVHAQMLPPPEHVRIDLEIGRDGTATVSHHLAPSPFDSRLEFIEGAAGAVVTAGGGGDIPADAGGALIPAGSGAVVAAYTVPGMAAQVDGTWTSDFSYPESVRFTMPEGAEHAFINGDPIPTGQDRRFACHGCRMLLEYELDAQSVSHAAEIAGREFAITVISPGGSGAPTLGARGGSVSFDVGAAGYVAATFSTDLLDGPYAVTADGAPLEFEWYNATDAGAQDPSLGTITAKLGSASRIMITGTAVLQAGDPAIDPAADPAADPSRDGVEEGPDEDPEVYVLVAAAVAAAAYLTYRRIRRSRG